MFWEAVEENGKVHKQILGEKFKDLDKSVLTELYLRDQPSAHSIPMDLNENVLKMPNFNQMLLETMPNIPDIHLTFDRGKQGYTFDEDSLTFLKSIIIQEEDFYSYFGFKNGTIIKDSKEIPYEFLLFENNEFIPLESLILETSELRYLYSAHSDFKVGMSVSKATTTEEGAQINWNRKFLYGDIPLDLNLELKFLAQNRILELNTLVYAHGRRLKYLYRVTTPEKKFEVKKETSDVFQSSTVFLGTMDF